MIHKHKKLLLVGIGFFLIASITFAASIIYPSNIPSGQIDGGNMKTVINNISSSCGAGNYLQGFNADGSLICKSIASLASATPSSIQNKYTASGDGLFRKYFNNILNDCGNGRYVRGFNSDKKMICSDKTGVETLVGLDLNPLPNPLSSLAYPSSVGTPSYQTYLTNILSNSCGVKESISGFDTNGNKLGCVTLIQNGVCGSAHTTIGSAAPTTNLCNSGTPSAVTGTGPWTWTCNGSGGGTTATCSVCPQHYYYDGNSCASIWSYRVGNPDHNTVCRKCGTTDVGGWRNCFSDGTCRNGQAIINKCISLYDTPATETCGVSTGINGVCGSAHTTTVSIAPNSNLCTTGTPSAVTGTGPWTWTCNGSGGGTTATCNALSVPSQECILDATLDCILVADTTPTYTYSWNTGDYGNCSVSCGGGTQTRPVTCQRNDGVSVADSFCTGNKPSTSQPCNTGVCVINGVCGTANNQKLPNLPSSQLCTSGISTQLNGPTMANNIWLWTWGCNGSNGGSNSSCSAEYVTYNATTTQAASAHGGSKTTLLGSHKHCVISRVYGDTERSAWNLSKLSQDTSICVSLGGWQYYENEGFKQKCLSALLGKTGDWIIKIDDEGGSRVAHADVLCTDEIPGEGGSTTVGALCIHNQLTGIFDDKGCCIIGSSATGDKYSRISGDFWNSCNP